MKRSFGQASDLKVRSAGLGLVLLATALLATLPARGGNVRLRQPTVMELCTAFLAVCSGSVGASLLCVGRQMFEPVPGVRASLLRDDDAARDRP